MDSRKNNGGKTKGKSLTVPVRLEEKKVDGYMPGQPFTIGKSLRGKVPVKAKKVPFKCVYKNCTNPTHMKKAKWCEKHRELTRAIAMRVNKERWLKRHSKAA